MATANLTQYTKMNVEMIEGSTLNATNATFTDDDSTDYSGYDSGTCLLKNDPADADEDAVLEFSTSNSRLVLSNGSFYFAVAPSITDGKSGFYYYSLKVKSGTDEYDVMLGTWEIIQRRVD